MNPPATEPDVHRYVHVVGSSVWIHDEPADPAWGRHFLGLLDGAAMWGIDVPHGEDPADGAAADLFSYFGRSSEDEWLVAGRAVQIVEWARTHRFCGRCGAPTELAPGERAMKCPACGLLAFPRLAPAMITLVTRGDGAAQEALLAQGVQFRGPMYSCLAGFVEPGESLEGAVAREVREETGLIVLPGTIVNVLDRIVRDDDGRVRYHYVLVDFICAVVGGDLRAGSDADDVQWVARMKLVERGIAATTLAVIEKSFRLQNELTN